MNSALGIGMTSQRTRNRMIRRLREQNITNEKVLTAMAVVPRHLFMDEAMAHRAYEDTALPIKHGQTISQPWVVARMTEIVMQHKPQKVLEIGTGSGYQAAILGQLVNEVFSVERIDDLTKVARRRFIKLGYNNVRTKTGDGFKGWKSEAPYDLIIATAAPDKIPENLLSQLKQSGIMLLPVGDNQKQNLVKVTKTDTGYDTEILEAVMFVPFLHGVIRA
ncbi:Protein-L-isoaspartate O-methyltransferase [hydrothermal vent metagenome]|uniref:protein-L-isoaspartate(D-aspartate) O-methyltransferase n=1 Tax=hydrothermal vent metagenome TaxID=652676 RepID=A0A3B0UW62_9ZZZZ